MRTVESVDLLSDSWVILVRHRKYSDVSGKGRAQRGRDLHAERRRDDRYAIYLSARRASTVSEKEFNPKAFILDETTNARWGMRFVWPIKADYRIVYVER